MPFIPSSVNTGNLKAYPQIAYDKLVVENWKANTPALELTDLRSMPKRAGRTNQYFGYVPFGPSVTTAAEGQTGAGLPLNQVTSQTYLDQFVDYISFSDVAESTFISPIVAEGAAELAYRGALTINTICTTQFDASTTLDSKTIIDLADNEFLTSAIIRRCEMSLDAVNVPRRADGMFGCMGHPLMFYDLMQDNTAGSVVDVIKRHDAGINSLQMGSKSYNVVDWAGVRCVRTTTVPTYANLPSSGKTAYALYVVGKEAFISSSLYNEKLPRDKNFQVMVSYFQTATPDNPALQVSAAVAFNFLFGVGPRPNTNNAMGYRRVRGEVSIV
jgi:N4-gp56 family major capsid protein